MIIFRCGKLAILPIATSLAMIAAGVPAVALAQDASAKDRPSPLVEKVRAATDRFRNINAATAAGFVQATPCVSGPEFGAMGVHFVLSSRVNGAVLSADQPEALIYEPQPGGTFRLVGVEYIILASLWAAQHPDGETPALDGNLLNYIEAPNRYGLPAFYELHVWAWEHNPVGNLADWNTHVTCTHQQADP
jgi:hypothetical protein